MADIVRADAHGILPDEIGNLITRPVLRMSVAMQVATVVTTGTATYRVPIVAADPSAAWTAEGAVIATSATDFDEVIVTPSKVAGLSVISSELANDSSPSAHQIVGEGLARDIARKVDAAFFGNTTTNGPAGLLSLAGVQVVDTGATIANTDPFAEALSKAETQGAEVSAFVTHPDTLLTLAKVKKMTGSNEPLLGFDATGAAADPTNARNPRTVLGVPIIPSPAVTAGTVWAIPRDRVLVVVREDTTLEVDRSAYFSSDSVGVRAIMRVGFAYPHEAAVVRLYDAP